MTEHTQLPPPAPASAPRRQLRLALSMNGGVSLAVWIGGAVAEVDRIRRGEDHFWRDLLIGCGYFAEAQVDVMAGASAGGLNAVMMAAAIHANVPFAGFIGVWQEAADITELVREPRRALTVETYPDSGLRRNGARAVLDGGYFLDTLHDALDKVAPAAPSTLSHDLAVLVSATLVRSNTVEFRDVPGDPISDSRGDAYFHVAKRGSHQLGMDGFADPGGVADRWALARIGRATSSLPGLFEPCEFSAGQFGSRLVGAFRHDRPTVEIMDGGVVDNVPIARAIRAIYNSPATTAVRRVLLYLHPDPGGPDRGAPDDPDSVVGVVGSFSGKRAESIREDIEVLRAHNDGVERRRALAVALLSRTTASDGVVASSENVAALKQAADRALLLRAMTDPASELGWHAPLAPRLAPLIDAPGDESKRDLAANVTSSLAANPAVLVAAECRRAVAALRWTVFLAQQDGATADFSATLSKLDTLATLTDLVQSYQLARMLGHGPEHAADPTPRGRLQASFAELQALTVDPDLGVNPPSVGLPASVAATWTALATWDLTRAGAGAVTLAVVLSERIGDALRLLPEASPSGAAAAALANMRTVGAAALQEVTARLLQLLSEPVASDQRIDFVRVAGDVITEASRRFLADGMQDKVGDRIAGKQLHHLGAFFHRGWRDNDWRWGRLDSVPALLDAVLDDQAVAHLRASAPTRFAAALEDNPTADALKQRLLLIRQAQIVAEELDLESEDPETVFASVQFQRWRQKDRRLASLLGSRQLLSAGNRAAMTATRVVAYRAGWKLWTGVQLLRPIVLAIMGFALGGRWAAPALAWSACVLGAIRTDGDTARGWVFGLGVASVIVAVLMVEWWLRPTRPWYRWVVPYALALAGIGVGAVAISHRDELRSAEIPILHWSAWWVVPALAATVASFSLFFWMRWYACALMMTMVTALYGGAAFLASQYKTGRHWGFLGSLPITRSIWTAFIVAVLVLPVVAMTFPETWLSPPRRRPSGGRARRG